MHRVLIKEYYYFFDNLMKKILSNQAYSFENLKCKLVDEAMN